MTLYFPLWLQNATGGYNAITDRQFIGATLYEGVLGAGDLAVGVRGAGANMSVDVAPGKCAVQGDDFTAQGKYVCASDAIANVTIAASPGTGSSRIDLIIAQVRDSEAVGGSNNDWILSAVTGTAGSSPVAPALPPSALLLAQIAVGSGVVTITSGNITDKRSFGRPLALVPALPAAANPGQIVSVAGTDAPYIGDSDQGWVPLVRGDLVQRQAYSISDASIGGTSGIPWGSVINFAQPHGQVSIYATVIGQMASGAGSTNAQMYLRISTDGGATWQTGRNPGATSPNGFSPVVMSAQALITAVPSGVVQVQAMMIVSSGGLAVMSQGLLVASLMPA